MTLRGFADGFGASSADIGALAMVQLADGTVLASAGAERNEVFAFGKDGGHSVTPLFTLDQPIMDMAVDQFGQLWVMTGSQLLMVDASTGAIIDRLDGPGGRSLTGALAIDPSTGRIYASSGSGIEIFDPKADTAHQWSHFSNLQVTDLAFGPDGRLWGVRFSGSDVESALPNATTDIVSLPMSGANKGNAQLEYRLRGIVESIAFGQAGTALAGLMFASTSTAQRAIASGADASATTPHTSSVWMVSLASRDLLQLATGGTRGQALLTRADGSILVAETAHIDLIAPVRAPSVTATSIEQGAVVPLPVSQVAVVFDQAMWTGADGSLDPQDASSVLDPANYSLVSTDPGTALVLQASSVSWNAATRTASLLLPQLSSGHWQLLVSSAIRSAAQVRLAATFTTDFTAMLDMSSQVGITFADTRADHLTGEISYDVNVTNLGDEVLHGPLMLLLDPGRYFDGAVQGAQQGPAMQGNLWELDLSSALQAAGGSLAVGATLSGITVSVRPASNLGDGALVKFNLGHGVYAMPYANTPATISTVGVADTPDATTGTTPLVPAAIGSPWIAQLQANDVDGSRFFWELVQAPAGMTLAASSTITSDATGYHDGATLQWTPQAGAPADATVLVRVVDSRGSVSLRRFTVAVTGGNHAPVLSVGNVEYISEGQPLQVDVMASDPDGDPITLTVRNLPAGAKFDATNGVLSWTPGYDQAGVYKDVTVIATDGKTTVTEKFDITVSQGFAKPVLNDIPAQTLREGEQFALQLDGSLPGDVIPADGTSVKLVYGATGLPAGMTVDADTGWVQWAPDYTQHGDVTVRFTLTAAYSKADGSTPIVATVTRDVTFHVLNANGAPVFAPVDTWNILEGQLLRVSVFAFDPDNPGFQPRTYLQPAAGAVGGMDDDIPSTITYAVSGLPPGAAFDPQTMEIVWTPGYTQAGNYAVTVVATDTGDGTGVPLSSRITVPIIISNANRAPVISNITNAIIDRGTTLDIPVVATDADGDPVTLTIAGLPPFATFIQNADGTGTIHFAPGAQTRGDYTLTVTAQDDGDGDPDQVSAQSLSFVVTVRSPSEAPVVSVPRQSVAIVGQTVSIPIMVTDLDQDALSYAASGLPDGASIVTDPQYGLAWIVWTPRADQLGAFDLSLRVSDQGLPPANAGYIVDPNNPPVPNLTVADMRIVVRVADAPPQLIAMQATGGSVNGDPLANGLTTVTASEGVPLRLELSARDADQDYVNWTLQGAPAGMTVQAAQGTDGQTSFVLNWTPGYFAAQSDDTNGATPGHYHLLISASDGSAVATRTIDLLVANTNQAPRIPALPLQLVQEGETLSFALVSSDPDGDAVHLSLVRDADTPAGVNFDPTSGTFEWTPSSDIVDNAAANGRAFSFTFSATDGVATTLRTVQVRVQDVNRAPTISASSHAMLVGQTFGFDVVKAGTAALGALRVADPDGAAQTAALVVSFSNLPEGASYDALTGRFSWTPGPGQVGDHVVLAKVSDGIDTVMQSFTLRVVADASANAPKILLDLTPSTPVLPGQTALLTVRASSYATIVATTVQVRGSAIGASDWQTVSLDSSGRLKLSGTAPGLIEVRATVIDADGFSATQTQSIRVRDPQDTTAPLLSWGGAFAGTTITSAPVTVSAVSQLQARISDLQLMGWKVQIAPSFGGTIDASAWTTLASASFAAINTSGVNSLAAIDPSTLANGVYAIRLTAWDLNGRTSQIDTRVVIDSATKQPVQGSATDVVFHLGNHELDLTRVLSQDAVSSANAQDGSSLDFGNWTMPLFDTHLTTDQDALTPLGMTAPWMQGARVWLQVPASLSQTDASTRFLSFVLQTQDVPLGATAGAPVVTRTSFTTSDGWTLTANDGDESQSPALQREGQRLYDQATGLPWQPQGFVVTAPDGTRYSLDAQGHVQRVAFSDGQQWLVSDAGIVLVGSADPAQRVTFLRDSQGRISLVSGPQLAGSSSVSYGYDAQGRLVLARALYSVGAGTQYGYHDDGSLINEPIAANLGTAVGWAAQAASRTDSWSGSLHAGTPVNLSFAVRQSELDSTVHALGAQGAVIVAVRTTGDVRLSTTGATLLGQTVSGSVTVSLLRIDAAGLKLLTLAGEGPATVSISLAGDLNEDGVVDGMDSALMAQGGAAADLNGDGKSDSTDRQVLYANFGWHANEAPVAAQADGAQVLLTHVDLEGEVALTDIAKDYEGDAIHWTVAGATHGAATLSSDGKSLLFTPEPGFAGIAQITLLADDGYATSAPIHLSVDVSDAKLLTIRVDRLATLANGSTATLNVTGDFADQVGVHLIGSYVHFSSTEASVAAVNANGVVAAKNSGIAVIGVQAKGISAVNAISVNLTPTTPIADGFGNELDVFPPTVDLAAGVGQRQIDVNTFAQDVWGDDIHAAAAGTVYYVSNPDVVQVTADGLILAKGAGSAIITIVNGGLQGQIHVRVVQPQIGAIQVAADQGGVVEDSDGNTLMIGAGALPRDATVSIQSVALSSLSTRLPFAGEISPLAAVHIDLSGVKADTPVQLALKVNGPVDPATGQPSVLDEGTEVLFWREGTIRLADGTDQPTWWLVDNGVIGSDGLAHTASPPYDGVMIGGNFVATTAKTTVNQKTGAVTINGWATNWNAVWSNLAGAAFTMSGLSVGVGCVTLLQSGLTDLMAVRYSIAGSYQTNITAEQAFSDDPALTYPADPITPDDITPQITGIDFDAKTRQVSVSGVNFIPQGQSNSNFSLKVVLQPRGNQLPGPTDWGVLADRGLVWQSYEATLEGDKLVFNLPEDVSLSQHVIRIQRQTLGSSGSGDYELLGQIDSPVVQGWKTGTDETLVTTSNAINMFVGIEPDSSTSPTNSAPISLQYQITKTAAGDNLQIARGGTSTIAFSEDGTLAFIGGEGRKVYVLDTLTHSVVYTIQLNLLVTGRVSSLVTANGWLYVATTSDATGPGCLVRVDCSAEDDDYLQRQVVLQMRDAQTSGGYRGLAVNTDSYLAVTTVNGAVDIINLSLITKDGLIEDMTTLVHSDPRSTQNKNPTFVTAGTGDGEFMVSNTKDWDNGLAIVNVGMDSRGYVATGTTAANALVLRAALDTRPQPTSKLFHQDILYSAGTVIVTYGGVEYALVGDQNLWFDDAIAPRDGSLPQYQIGGKIGVIQNPFGRNGQSAKYLGATTPIAGSQIQKLTVGQDGTL
jgi:hypothetical protein